MRRIGLLVLCATSVARADDPRAAFGLAPKSNEAPLDCRDGTAFGCVAPTDAMADDDPFALSTWLPAAYLLSLPVADATHDEVVAYAMGASQDEAGPVFAGANGLENRWTIDGAPADNVRTGAVDTRVPLAFLDGILVTNGGFSARDRTSTGGAIDARLRRGGDRHEIEAYAWLTWNGEARQQQVAADTYQVRRGQVDDGPVARAAVVATGPLGDWLGGRAWYAAGIAPAIASTTFEFTAGRLSDRDGDMIPDGYPGVLDLDLIENTSKTVDTYSVPMMARAGLDRGPHHFEATLIGTAGSDALYRYNATLQAAGIDEHTLVGDAIATYRGEWADTHVRVQAAWHYASRTQDAADPKAANLPQLLSAYVPTSLAEDPALAGACNDMPPGDPYPGITNCPVPAGYFLSGGAGELSDTTANRPSLTADISHVIDHHVLRAGGTIEASQLLIDSRFTGGDEIRSLFPGEASVRNFIDPNLTCPSDPSQACPTVAQSQLDYRTRYTAAYAEDTWHPERDLAVDGGMRWELMWVGTSLHFSDELAPRLGMTWDPLGNGRSRVWASMGRSFAMLPAGLGATVLGSERTVDNVTSPFGTSRIVETGAAFKIAPGIEPVSQDELTLGGDVNLARAVRLRAWLQGRWLHDGLDTTEQGFDNPGRNGEVPPAIRQTGLFALELETAPTAKLVLRAGYTYAQTIGSWTGAYDPREGAVLYAGTDFDTPPVNQLGRLPTDLGHRFYLEAERHATLGSVKLAVSTRLLVQSGRPRDLMATADTGTIYLIPRGAAGSDPMVSQANVRLAASWQGFDVTLDVLNAFDQRTTTYVNPFYSGGDLQPIDGGSYADLVFLHNGDGSIPRRLTTYDQATEFQAPISVVLGVHRAF
ncbi:MAG TPA: hypothetical protein VLX92_00635 [Kofleriaceae bacterium]|nr:hypothetical protein [Kofleriaceae bacterium]